MTEDDGKKKNDSANDCANDGVSGSIDARADAKVDDGAADATSVDASLQRTQPAPVEFDERHQSPFLDALGIEVVRADSTGSELSLVLDDRHFNRWAVAHGGVTMTLLDSALALAARHASDGARGLVTVEMKVTFMQPGRGRLKAIGRVLHRSTTMAFCDGEVYDADGGLVAKALGTFKYLRRLPVGRDVATERR